MNMFVRKWLVLVSTGYFIVAFSNDKLMANGRVLYLSKGCDICHGLEGKTPKYEQYPFLAGQQARYTLMVLQAYKSEERQGAAAQIMWDQVALLKEDEMKQIADYLAKVK